MIPEEIIRSLTLEQKAYLVTGAGFDTDTLHGSDKVPGAAGSTFAVAELDIPGMVLADGPAGVRIHPTREGEDKTYYATAFPTATALASTWDTSLVEQVGSAMGEEVREYGVDLLLAPGMNLHYNPLGGRNFEYYSEDPVLSGRTAAAMVRGVQSQGVGATIKHFVANNAETSRMWLDARISERALRELYLKGFEIAVRESAPWAVMTSYNKVNGTYTSQDERLLETILRKEWGFDGLVMTDWFAGDSAVEQVKAGNDLIMPGMPDQREAIIKAVQSGELDEALLDRNIARILKVVNKAPVSRNYSYHNTPDLVAHATVARQAAAEGSVLLKNNARTLPLKNTASLAVFGNTSYDFIAGGTGSGDVNSAYTVSLVEGLEAAGFTLDDEIKKLYAAHIKTEKARQPEKQKFFELLPPLPEWLPKESVLESKAAACDIALITLGRNSGEFQDRAIDNDFNLTATEQQLIEQIAHAFHQQGKPVVVVLNIGNVIETASWRDQVDAILLPWQGGQEAGHAVADVLTGKTSPSGKLPTSFPLRYADVPSAAQFPGHAISEQTLTDRYTGDFFGHHSQLHYTDDIFMGYRYYARFNEPVAYEFGFGLSYTQFEFSDMQVSEKDAHGNRNISINVTNTGEFPGREVVQLYFSHSQARKDVPVRELKAFAKTRLLQPQESQTIILQLAKSDCAVFDTNAASWIIPTGECTLAIGNSSANTQLEATICLTS